MSSPAPVRDWAPQAPRPVTPTTILAEELDQVCRMLEESGVDRAPLARLKRARDLAAGLDPYLDRCTTPESPALADLARRTQEVDWESVGGPLEREMLSGHVEGQFLKFLVHMTGARRILEIGMFTGYSALAMAEELPDDGVVVACELDGDVAERARQCFAASPVGHRIEVEVGPATDTLRRFMAEQVDPFDFVFIDADKAGYREYVDALLDGSLLAEGAVIAVDNTLMQGQPYLPGERTANGTAIAAFNDAVTDDPRVEQVLVPLRDGVTLIRRVSS